MPRSGTTLLARFLASGGPYVALPESHFFSRFVWTSIHRRSEASLRAAWSAFASSLRWPLSERLDACEASSMDWRGAAARYRATYLAWVATELRARGREPDSSCWVDKSPPHVEGLRFILRLFPKARIVGLIRDPRAVQASLASVDWNRAHPAANAVRWSWYSARLNALAVASPRRVRLVSYEELVRHPASTMGDLADWLQVPFDAGGIDGDSSGRDHGFNTEVEPWKVTALSAPHPDRIDAWPWVLPSEEVATVERWAATEMARNGYYATVAPGRLTIRACLAAQRMQLRLAIYALASGLRVWLWRVPLDTGPSASHGLLG